MVSAWYNESLQNMLYHIRELGEEMAIKIKVKKPKSVAITHIQVLEFN